MQFSLCSETRLCGLVASIDHHRSFLIELQDIFSRRLGNLGEMGSNHLAAVFLQGQLCLAAALLGFKHNTSTSTAEKQRTEVVLAQVLNFYEARTKPFWSFTKCS